MQKLNRGKKAPLYVPDYFAESLLDVDFKALKAAGIKYVAFDADATLVSYRGTEITPEIQEYLRQNRNLFSSWCIASNRITDDLFPLGQAIDAEVIRATLFTRKPSKRFFKRVVDYFGAPPHEIAMVGDKLIADMFGAKQSGFVTVWVEKLGKDSAHDRLFAVRQFEKHLMRRYM